MLRFALLLLLAAGSQAVWWNPSTWFEPAQRVTPVGTFDNEPPFTNANGHVPQAMEDIEPQFFIFCRGRVTPDFVDSRNYSRLGQTCFRAARRTVVIIHGYRDDGERATGWQRTMKDKILQVVDANVIVLSWAKGAGKLIYSQAAANTRVVGATGAKLVGVAASLGLDPANVHCVGHSLGSHTCGYLGSTVLADLGQPIGRITGLDPAGPCFHEEDVRVRLDKSDALFVDAIHTDCESLFQAGFGMYDRSGDQDFYPNGGLDQPGCPHNMLDRSFELLTGGIGDYVDGVACSHMRAIDLFTESITAPPAFEAQECPTPEHFQLGECWSCSASGHVCTKMGWHARPVARAGSYDLCLKTNAQAPFRT